MQQLAIFICQFFQIEKKLLIPLVCYKKPRALLDEYHAKNEASQVIEHAEHLKVNPIFRYDFQVKRCIKYGETLGDVN